MSEFSETGANAAADASGSVADASGATAAEASNNAPPEASNTADALAVVLESNLPTFVAGNTKIVGALRRCDKSWRDALGAHPASRTAARSAGTVELSTHRSRASQGSHLGRCFLCRLRTQRTDRPLH